MNGKRNGAFPIQHPFSHSPYPSLFSFNSLPHFSLTHAFDYCCASLQLPPIATTHKTMADDMFGLNLNSRGRTILANKCSGRVLDSDELEEQKAQYDRIKREVLHSDEDGTELLLFPPYLDSEFENELDNRFKTQEGFEPNEPLLEDRMYNTQPVKDLPIFAREDLAHNKKAWHQIYVEGGVKKLAETVIKEIEQRLADKHATYDEDTEWSVYVMEEVLMSTDRILLESILFGNLAMNRRNNPKLDAILRNIQAQSTV